MKKLQIKANIFDFIIIFIIIFLTLSIIISSQIKSQKNEKNVLVTVRIKSNLDVIYPEYPNLKDYGEVYLNSVNNPVKVIGVKKEYENGNIKWVDITVSGKGDITNSRFVFNGKRILIGQKTEIHSKYFAQGLITEVKYGDK